MDRDQLEVPLASAHVNKSKKVELHFLLLFANLAHHDILNLQHAHEEADYVSLLYIEDIRF